MTTPHRPRRPHSPARISRDIAREITEDRAARRRSAEQDADDLAAARREAAARRPSWLTRHATNVGIVLFVVAVLTVLAAMLIAVHADAVSLQVIAVVLGIAGTVKAVFAGILLGGSPPR